MSICASCGAFIKREELEEGDMNCPNCGAVLEADLGPDEDDDLSELDPVDYEEDLDFFDDEEDEEPDDLDGYDA